MNPTPPADPAADREERLQEVLLACVEALQAGTALDRRQLLAAHPDFGPELEDFFAGYEEMEHLAAPLRTAARSLEAPRPDGSELGQLGDFRLLREVGRGGMGVVYEAEQISLRRRVALKVLPFASAIDPRQLQRFKNEALAAANLRHESIVPVHAVGMERGVHYYAMQFIDGQSLAALIGELRRLDGSPQVQGQGHAATTSLSLAATISRERSSSSRRYFDWLARLGRQAAQALEHAHQTGIVHRDIKPANLLLDPQGQLWIADFGLAQVTGDAGLTLTGELLGTLRYASPEQARARGGVVDHRTDIYSLGATLYELLTLRPIFAGRDRHELLRQIADDEPAPPRSVCLAVPVELETIVLKALGKEPADRYATAQELADDLQRFLDDRPILARRPTPAEHLRKWARRHPAVVVTAVVVLLLLSVGSLVSTALIHGEQRRTKVEQQKAEQAFQRERLRADEAEVRFRLARRAVDELFRVSEEELADRPGTEGLRKRLLTSVLAYYEEFLAQRRDDPHAQADLLDTTKRVARILADLGVLRAASQLYLLGQPLVLDDLALRQDQRTKVKEFVARVEKQWQEHFASMGQLTPAERRQRFLEQARANDAAVNDILAPKQRRRLRQIGLQVEGAVAFRDAEVVAALRLTAEQRERIRAIEDEAFFGWMKFRPPGASQAPKPKEKTPTERILALLTPEQTRQWETLTGKPCKGLPLPFPPFGPPPPKGPR